MTVRRLAARPGAVVALGAAPYLVWFAWLAAGHDPAEAATVGQRFLEQGDGSAPIERLAGVADSSTGYDGQFSLFVALDPTGAERYLDAPGYRYGRILQPLAARALAAGREDLVPWMLLAVGFAGMVGGTYALARLLLRHRLSPWWALVFPAYPGVFFAVTKDLTEPLAYGLVAAAALAFVALDGRRRIVVAGVALALAGLASETALVFAAALAIGLLLEGRGRKRLPSALVLLVVATAPYVALRLGLAAALDPPTGDASIPAVLRPAHRPFAGLLDGGLPSREEIQQLLAVAAPALLVTAAALVAYRSERWRSWTLPALVSNALVLVVFLPAASWIAWTTSGRISTGVVVAFVCCLPRLLERGLGSAAWLGVVLWLSAWYDVFPSAFDR